MALLALSAEKEQASPFPTIFDKYAVTKVAGKAGAAEAKELENMLKDAVDIAEICRNNDAWRLFSSPPNRLYLQFSCL